MTLAHRDALLKMLARISFRLGEFKLARRLPAITTSIAGPPPLPARAGALPAWPCSISFASTSCRPRAVGGLTLGADPIVCNVAAASAWHALEVPGSPVLDGFLVRKAEKYSRHRPPH